MTTGQKTTSMLLKILVALSAVIGTILSALEGRTAFMGVHRVCMYFTIQSNIAVAMAGI